MLTEEGWLHTMSRVTMRLPQSILAIAICSILVCQRSVGSASDKQSEGMGLIKHAVVLTDLQSEPHRIRMRVTVVDSELGKREGTDLVTFSSSNLWRRDLNMTGYDEVAVFRDHQMYRTRSLRFTPPSLRKDIGGSLRNLPETLAYKVLKVFNRKLNGVELRCAYLRQQNEKPVEITWCFDPQTGLPAAELWESDNSRIEFSGYRPLGSRFVPGRVEVIVSGKSTGKSVIEAIDTQITDAAHVFDPPAGATPQAWCDNMQMPRPISVWPPDIPVSARYRKGLELNYELTVDTRGNVAEIVPMAAKPFVDRIAIEAMHSWQFGPAMCDGTPVPTDIWIDIAAMMHF
jgi:hypothetical protein